MFSRIPILLCTAAIVFALAMFYRLSAFSSRGGEGSPLFSVRRHDPYGTAALHDLLSERNIHVELLQRPTTPDINGVLVQVLDANVHAVQPSGGRTIRAKDLQDWIADGNTVIQLTRARTELMSLFGIKNAKKNTSSTGPATLIAPGATVWPDEEDIGVEGQQRKGAFPDELLGIDVGAKWMPAADELFARSREGIEPLSLFEPQVFDEINSLRWKPLARIRRGVAAWSIAHGRGRLVVVGAPSPALNWMIDEGGNLEFLLAVVGDGPVIFDEWSHGFGNAGTIVGIIREFGLFPVILQVLFVLVLYSWSTRGHRRVDRAGPPRRRSSREQIDTLGFLYGHSFSGADACRHVAREVRRRLASALRCPPRDVEAQLKHVKPEKAEQVRQLLAALNEAERLSAKERKRRINARLVRILEQSHHLVSGELL